MSKIISFLKKETVLVVALLLAAISACFVHPNPGYLGYIDFNTLFLLFALMSVMALFRELGIFEVASRFLLGKVSGIAGILSVLIFFPFFLSMIITNDVALITFVPLALITLDLSGLSFLGIPVVVLQTVAANLGSMMLPMGNPQNLYLYNACEMGLFDFVKLMAPYSAFSLVMIIIGIIIISLKNKKFSAQIKIQGDDGIQAEGKNRKLSMAVAISGFIVCLLSVLKIFPAWIPALIVLISLLTFSRKTLLKVDYSLLMTFVGFFIFVGNIKNIEAVSNFLSEIIKNREVGVSIAASQIISNVPAALLLSGWTENLKLLIIGTNLGGLGTLIASMASLISFKLFTVRNPEKKGRYFIHFTWVNVLMLALVYGLYHVLTLC